MVDHNPHNPDLNGDRPTVEQVLAWLEAHGINRRLVPADPRASIIDGRLTIQLWISGAGDQGVLLDPSKPNEPLRQTVTVPVVETPSPTVEAWLAPCCPMCGR